MKLYKRKECPECKGQGKHYNEGEGVAYTCDKCLGLRFVFEELSPAELAALDLGALIVLSEFYRRIEKTLLDTIRYGPIGKRELLNQIKVELDDLKSRHLSEPDKYKELLEKARAWEILVTLREDEDPTGKFRAIIRAAQKEARQSLGLERKEEEEK